VSLESKVFKSVSWLALFSVLGQGVSWAATILIAHILVPGDYGLMSMATIITGYASIFSELGLGNAIIQRPNINKSELSSVFWFSMGFTSILALFCFPAAFLTASIMHEPRVIPLTQTVGFIFILNGLQIVPSSLLRRELDFKSLGFIDMSCAIISCLAMFAIAKLNGGVWTLIGGYIIRSFLRTIFLFKKGHWRPSFHFNFKESKPYLSFGIAVALGRSLYYVQEKSDRFFAGRAWKADILGYYTFALEMAQIPTDKIVSVINNVSFSAFSKLQNDKEGFNKFYLNINKVTLTIVLPLFIGGFIVGDDIIRLFLNEKWYPIITIFRFLCLSQILTSLNAVNSFVHSAQGRPQWSLYYNIVSVIVMPISFYIAVKHGLNGIVVPWLSSYLVLSAGWIVISIRKIGISFSGYCSNVAHPFFASILMCIAVSLVHRQNYLFFLSGKMHSLLVLIVSILVGAIFFGGYFWFVDKKFLISLRSLIK